jgi:hypothetical protein
MNLLQNILEMKFQSKNYSKIHVHTTKLTAKNCQTDVKHFSFLETLRTKFGQLSKLFKTINWLKKTLLLYQFLYIASFKEQNVFRKNCFLRNQ